MHHKAGQGRAHRAFDFDYWKRLAAEQPARFERERRAALDALIDSAATERQGRLRSLQWKLDQVRRLAPNPMAACLHMQRLMWERVLGREGLVEVLQDLGGGGTRAPVRTARVLRLQPEQRC